MNGLRPQAGSSTTFLPAGVDAGDWIAAASIVAGSIVLSLIAHRVLMRVLSRGGAHEGASRLISRSARYVIVLLGFFFAAGNLGIAIGPLIGALGIGGIVLGLALQDILANMVSGILLQTRRPFRRGDQIETNGFSGTVEDVNLRVVNLITFDGDNVFIPNAMVLQNPITNWTRMPTRRTTLDVGVAYGTDLDRARAILIDAAAAAEGVLPSPAPEAFVQSFDDSSISIAVRFWHGADAIERWRARDAVARRVKAGLDAAGITIPFPQRTLWFGPGNTTLRLEQQGPPAPTPTDV